MITHIHKIQPGGKSVLYERKGDTALFRKTIGSDTLELEINGAGIYCTVRMYRGQFCCIERMYGLKDGGTFWLYARDVTGRGNPWDSEFVQQRQARYPQGAKVRLGCSIVRESQKSSQ